MKILLTGGAGNVGSALAKGLVKHNQVELTIVDNLSTGSKSKLPSREYTNWNFIKADTNDQSEMTEIMVSHQFDYVFHYAALVGVQRTQDNPVQVLEDITGIRNILYLCKNTGVKRVFYSSSSEVYGEPVELPQHEQTTPLNSRVPYAVVKNVGESFCKSFHKEFDLEYTVFRFFNTYGPNQTTDFVISKFLEAALKNKPITIYGDGSQTRTFCYVDDNVEACLKTLFEDQHINDVINIGGADVMTILELAQTIIRVTGSSSEIQYLPPLEEGDMTRRQPDNSKMKKLLGRELLSLEEGIKKMMKSPEYLSQIGM